MAALSEQPELAPRHIALMSVPRSIDDDALEIYPHDLHFCDKPLLPARLRRLCDAIFGRGPPRLAGDEMQAGSLYGMHVLLVEDNATSRDVAIALMGRWGIEVDTARRSGCAGPACRRAPRSLRAGLHGLADACDGWL